MSAATQDSGIRSGTDVEKGIVTVVADIDASPERVFHALTDPTELPRWWAVEGAYRTGRFENDLRPGGKWKLYIETPERSGGSDSGNPEPQTVGGEYITVDPPHVLEFTWSPSWDGFAVSTVRYDIEATPTGSRITVTHSGFAGRPEMGASHGEGWVRVIGLLARHFSVRD
jgi:uncharacterized protein YndB with AHSA1/START domain